MNQYMAIRRILRMLDNTMELSSTPELTEKLSEIRRELLCFLEHDIDFKEIIDGLDDSIFITDNKGIVLYVNPAYTKNTGVLPGEVLGRNVSELIGKDKIYTGGAVPDVLKTGKPVFRLSTTYKGGQEKTGYVSGTPIFDSDGNLRQVVALSRPILNFTALQNDFKTFIQKINALEQNQKTITKNSEEFLTPHMIGKDTTLANIWTLISHVAPSDATVLITGESGAGKEVIADEIYKNSSRCHAPFIKINCASIPAHLLESELFGYEKGAFSGASSKGKRGLFELANHGTLMLDEIGDMPMDLQVKLLRAIQQQEITRVGGTKPIRLDIRFLALTNSDLKEKIANGTFRQDLFYRLNVIPIHVPPLRERMADIEALCDYFIGVFSEKYHRSFSLTPKQYGYFHQYQWPGNIRELENIMEYLVLCSSGVEKVDNDLITSLLHISRQQETIPAVPGDFNEAVARFEKQLLERTLAESDSLRDAGKKLNINASTISRKIKQYHIDYPASGKKSLE